MSSLEKNFKTSGYYVKHRQDLLKFLQDLDADSDETIDSFLNDFPQIRISKKSKKLLKELLKASHFKVCRNYRLIRLK